MRPIPPLPTVLVVDDDPAFRRMLETWLSHSGYRVRTAANGIDALVRLKQQPFDVVVTDLKMPGLDGLELLTQIEDTSPTVEVIFLSGHATTDAAIAALRRGRAFDFLLKPLKDLHLLNLSIEQALAKKSRTPSDAHANPLSPRERQIVALVAEGYENRDIGEKLCISENTVKNHLARIYDKLKVSNRVQAALTCERMGWL